MVRKQFSDKDVLNLLRQNEPVWRLAAASRRPADQPASADAKYYTWFKKYGGMGKSELQERKGLKKNFRLKKNAVDRGLDKLALTESFDYLKPRV
jgi:hypothetical protein